MRFGLLAPGCGFFAMHCALLGQGTVPPAITTQPASITAYVGEPAALTATIEGSAPLSLQWYKNGVVLAGATDATYAVSAAALSDLANYYLVATNAAGSATTTPAAIYVTKRPQTITFTVPPAVVAAGSGLVLNATSSAKLPVTFSLLAGSATLTGNMLTGSGGNVVVRASQPGTAAIAAAEPIDRTITFVAGALSPFITSPPADQTVTAGSSASFRAAAIGTPAPTYQWQRDGTAIPGATAATLTLTNTTLADSGRYGVTVTNLLGSTTAAATLTVRAAPVFTTTPASQTVFAGGAASFTVAATGFPAPAFQWRKNGVAIAGATNATLNFASTLATDAGRFDVVATNALGATTSAAATLAVTTRDFSGSYIGQFRRADGAAAATGNFALLVRANRTAVFLGHIPSLDTGIAALDLTVDLSGNFARSVTTGTRNVTLRGALDESTGELAGTVPESGLTLQGARAPRTGPTSAQAGFYQAALVGSADGRGYLVVAADGQAFLLLASGAPVDSARGTVGPSGRLAFTTTSQAAVDLGFNNGSVSGTVRAGTATGTLLGAIESLLGGERLVNLSVRSTTQPAAPLIAGFVISGTASKQVLIRAAGPALAQAPFNVPGALGDPTLQLFRGSAVVAQNDNWSVPAANAAAISAASARAGAFPFANNSNDAALIGTLPAGPYTVMIGGGNGVALAEVYEIMEASETAGARRLVNVSARGLVAPTAPLIAGFVVTGAAPQRVLIRGIGPTLGLPPFNVAGALPNPQLTLFRGNIAVKNNDDWFRGADATLIRDAALRVGAFALGPQSADAAMLLYLEPGVYTAQVSGPANGNNGTGIALVEVYAAAP